MLMMEVPAWIMFAMAIAILILAWGILWNFTDRFRRSKWTLRNTLTGEIWTTKHRFTPGEIRRLMKQRYWTSKLIRRSEE